jgi:hypothetical protein
LVFNPVEGKASASRAGDGRAGAVVVLHSTVTEEDQLAITGGERDGRVSYREKESGGDLP